MFTLRTLTTVGLVLLLAAGATAADKKGRSGNNHAKPKVQQRNQSKGAQASGKFGPAPPKRLDHQFSGHWDGGLVVAPKSASPAARNGQQRSSGRGAAGPKFGSPARGIHEGSGTYTGDLHGPWQY